MRAGETEQQMAIRHVAEQEKRIAQQEALIERLRKSERHQMMRLDCSPQCKTS